MSGNEPPNIIESNGTNVDTENTLLMIDWLMAWSFPLLLTSIVMLIGGLGLASWIIIRLPADHFVSQSGCPQYRHPALHAAWVVIRNLIGGTLVVAGIAMLILPGQGMLTILLGVSVMDLPGKRRLLRRILTWRGVKKTLNWIRRQADRPPLKFPLKE